MIIVLKRCFKYKKGVLVIFYIEIIFLYLKNGILMKVYYDDIDESLLLYFQVYGKSLYFKCVKFRLVFLEKIFYFIWGKFLSFFYQKKVWFIVFKFYWWYLLGSEQKEQKDEYVFDFFNFDI